MVIAIIGLLSSLAVVSLNSARQKAQDAQIKSDLSQLRSYMELNASDGDYSGITAIPANLDNTPCAGVSYTLNSATDSWAAASALCSDSATYFCVDSTGAASEKATALGTDTACPAT